MPELSQHASGTAHMNDQSQEPSGIEQLKARVEHLRTDAREALHAARHDYTAVLKAVRGLRAHSEVRAFVKTHLKLGSKTPATGKLIIRKASSPAKTTA